MSSRGRGYGGYGRGNGYGGGRGGGGYRGSYRGSSSRGSYEGRGGRGGYHSYNNESRYNSSGPRYSSSRDRIDEPYKKSYRSESSASYSNREYGRSGSPERKRMRIEGSSSERRSHDGSGHYGGSYGRQESYISERRPFSDERRRSPNRESYRKPSGMGPPREPARPSMRTRAPRRSFRGRTMRSRGPYRGAPHPRSRGSFASRRFGERSFGYPRTFRSVKGRSSIKSKDEEEASSTEEDWDADEKEETVEEKEPKIKSPKAEAEASEGEAGEPGDETDKEPDAASDAPPRRAPSNYVNLSCVHCKEKCATFAGYAKHLLSMKHRAAMSGVARRHKAQLLRMRVAQRGAQRELEEGVGADLAARTTFCLVCRLNHRTTRHAHNLTDTHRAMKRFLMPFCRICRIAFRSPMIYEHHICSIEHLKRKANQVVLQSSPKAEESGEEGMDVDLDNFMTLDSVGDVDEVEDDDSGGEKKDEASSKKAKVDINIGSEHIKKIEALWCELCRALLPRAEAGSAEEAETLRRHCRTRVHLSRYVQHRDTRTLRRQAERIHRQLHQQKEEEKAAAAAVADSEVKAEEEEPADDGKKTLENGTDNANASGGEDKLWADVDKDIGDLLREVEPQGNEGSDDEEDLGRYDKFRKSDKTKDGQENDESVTENVNNETANNEVNTPA